MKVKPIAIVCLLLAVMLLAACDSSDSPTPTVIEGDSLQFYFGADLSYVNQILDHGGTYMDSSQIREPYEIFKDHGANLARFRLWHNPTWTKEVYGEDGVQEFSDLLDVEKSISKAKEQGMSVLLDFHYSDIWTDPVNQYVPAAWADITDIGVLEDSVYRYTLRVLTYLNNKGLMPELVQVGNEINCGLFYSDQPEAFPSCNVCDGNWENAGRVLNAGIKAVREVSASTSVETKIALHVADPVNVSWWFEGVTTQGAVSDFDIIGFSYYPLWHTGLGVNNLKSTVVSFKQQFGKDVMILEIAYPWTAEWNDDYSNIMGGETPISGYQYTPQGQLAFMKYITQSLIDAGAIGLIYWEPAWISTPNMKDQWGTGSSWENCAFFDFDNNTLPGIDYMNSQYDFE